MNGYMRNDGLQSEYDILYGWVGLSGRRPAHSWRSLAG
jgi:hypothetical protein